MGGNPILMVNGGFTDTRQQEWNNTISHGLEMSLQST
jgi:hypothetical protein